MASNVFELNINLMQLEKSEAKEALRNTANGSISDGKKDKKEDDSLFDAINAVKGNFYVQTAVNKVVKPGLAYVTSKYGTIYGDVARQNQISNVNNGISTLSGIFGAAASGFAVGGPWGMAIALAAEAVNIAIDTASNVREYNEKQQEYLYESNYSQERLGLLAINKGR